MYNVDISNENHVLNYSYQGQGLSQDSLEETLDLSY